MMNTTRGFPFPRATTSRGPAFRGPPAGGEGNNTRSGSCGSTFCPGARIFLPAAGDSAVDQDAFSSSAPLRPTMMQA